MRTGWMRRSSGVIERDTSFVSIDREFVTSGDVSDRENLNLDDIFIYGVYLNLNL